MIMSDYLTTADITKKLKRVSFHLQNGNADNAFNCIGRIIRDTSYPWNRKRLEKIRDEIELGSPDTAELLIDVFRHL